MPPLVLTSGASGTAGRSSCRTPESPGPASRTPPCWWAPCPCWSPSSRRSGTQRGPPVAWAGFAVSLAGVGLITGGRGGGLTRRRRAGARVAAAVRHVHRRAGSPAARPGPHRGHRRAIPGRGPRRAAVFRRRGGPARGCRTARAPSWPPWLSPQAARCCPSRSSPTGRAGCPRRSPGRSSTSSRSWARCRGGPLRGPGRAGPGGGRCRHHRGHRAEQPSAAAPPPAAGKRGWATVSPVRVATWNVNSVKQRMPRLLPWLDQRQPDVVCLQETKLADEAFTALLGPELDARGYAVAIYGEPRWNGVAILSRAGLDGVVTGIPGAPGFPIPRRGPSPRRAAESGCTRCTSRTGAHRTPSTITTNSRGWRRCGKRSRPVRRP